MKFWDVVKEVGAGTIRQEAGRLFVLGIAGDPEYVARTRAMVLGNLVKPRDIAAVEPFLCCASPPYSEETEKRLRHADLLVSLPGGPGLTDFRPADTLQLNRVSDLPERVLERRPDLRLALARRLPGFREVAAQQVIREVSRVNAEFAAISGISQSIPFLMPLLPVVAGSDVLVLTKNQILMIFRLAAIYGEDMELKGRLKEVGTVVGGAFGWRTLARQLAGALPGALGLPVRAGIAFSGTYAVGRAAQMLFDKGRRPSREEMARIYEEGSQLGKEAVARLRERFRKRELSEGPKALPSGMPAELKPDEATETTQSESIPS